MLHRKQSRMKSTVVAHLFSTRSCPVHPQRQQLCTRRVPQDAFGPQSGTQAELEPQPSFLRSFQTSELAPARYFSTEWCSRSGFVEPNSIFSDISKNLFLGRSKTFEATLSDYCRRRVYQLASHSSCLHAYENPSNKCSVHLDLLGGVAALKRTGASQPTIHRAPCSTGWEGRWGRKTKRWRSPSKIV